ncbi:hypothetical protein [Motiliproteus sp. SC1-56]|uniref:hypothetical protein n=1 Tax=Motiliproteus sp. SC1-56 TaxID=2799565 RepID=UPI001A8F819A|nr:hypothetical protein [Motiliproteus sp. SC1-56]
MIARCKTNEAFEDNLTGDKLYPILDLRNGSVLIVNDREEERWYGVSRFQLVSAASVSQAA